MAEIEFPQYRKYNNNKSFFKIISESEFEEISVLGGYYILTSYTAKILPDRNFIKDMLDNKDSHWIIIGENDYIEVRNKSNHE